MSVLHNIRWARSAPVLRRSDGEPDGTAHHVLLALATFSDRDGRCRPSLSTLADAAYKTRRATAEALKRLVAAGLIKSDGEYGNTGVTVWVLKLGMTRSDMDESLFEDRRERAKKMGAARQRRWRDARRVTPSDDVTEDPTVTPPEGVTTEEVTRQYDVSNAVAGRHVTLFGDDRNAAMIVTSAGQGANRTIEGPREEPGRNTVSPAAKRARRSEYTAEFEAFWMAYGRKGAKGAAAREWQRAVKRAEVAVIMAAVGPYLASRPDRQYRKDAERWLRDDCWESEVVGTGHQTYRNPTDQSEYDEDLLP